MPPFEHLDSQRRREQPSQQFQPTYDGGLLSDTRTEMLSTLRGLRDTVAVSFQTLNLTLSSMNSTLRTMTSAFSVPIRSPLPNDISYAPSPSLLSTTGALSMPMTQFMSGASAFDLMTAPKPYNISPQEWSYNRNYELRNRLTTFGAGAGAGLLGFGANLGVTYGATAGLSRAFGLGRLATMGLGLPVAVGASMLLGPWTDAIGNAADTYGRDIAGIRRLSPAFGGGEFTQGQSAQVARSINRFGLTEAMNTNELDTRIGAQGYRTVLMQGLANNMFQGRSSQDLIKQAESGARVVTFLIGALGSRDVQEAMQTVVNMKQAGVNLFRNPSLATALGNAATNYSMATGTPAASLWQGATTHGFQAFHGVGLPAYAGVMPQLQNQYFMNWMERSRMMSPAMLSVGGGVEGIAKTLTQALATMMQMPQLGKLAMGGAMNPMGHINPQAFLNLTKGSYWDMLGAGIGNLATPGGYAMADMFAPDMVDQLAKFKGGQTLTRGQFNMVRGLYDAFPMRGDNWRQNQALFGQFLMHNIPGLDRPAALAMAHQALGPENLPDMLEGQAKQYAGRGSYARYTELNSPFRAFADAQVGIDRAKAWMHYNLVQRPGYLAYDMSDALVRGMFPHDQFMGMGLTTGGPPPSVRTLQTLNAMRSRVAPLESDFIKGMSEADWRRADRLAAYNGAGGAAPDWAQAARLRGDPILGGLVGLPGNPGNSANTMVGSAAIVQGYTNGFEPFNELVRSYMKNENAPSLQYLMGSRPGFLGNISSDQLLREFDNSPYASRAGGALQFLGSYMGPEYFKGSQEAWKGSGALRKLESGNAMEEISARFRITEKTPASRVFGLLNNNSQLADDLAAKYGVTKTQLAYYAMSNAEDFSSRENNFIRLMLHGELSGNDQFTTQLATALQASSDKGRAALDAMRGGVTMEQARASKLFDQFNLNPGMVSHFGSVLSQPGAVSAVAKALASRMGGNDDIDNILAGAGISDKTVASWVSGLDVDRLKSIRKGASDEASMTKDLSNLIYHQLFTSWTDKAQFTWGMSKEQAKDFVLSRTGDPSDFVKGLGKYAGTGRGEIFDGMVGQLGDVSKFFDPLRARGATTYGALDAETQKRIRGLTGMETIGKSETINSLYQKSIDAVLMQSQQEQFEKKMQAAAETPIGYAMSAKDGAPPTHVIWVKMATDGSEARPDAAPAPGGDGTKVIKTVVPQGKGGD